jgi:hypothetical protein
MIKGIDIAQAKHLPGHLPNHGGFIKGEFCRYHGFRLAKFTDPTEMFHNVGKSGATNLTPPVNFEKN